MRSDFYAQVIDRRCCIEMLAPSQLANKTRQNMAEGMMGVTAMTMTERERRPGVYRPTQWSVP